MAQFCAFPMKACPEPVEGKVAVMTRRTDRLNALLRGEISELLAREVKDPRLAGLVSITRVEVSPDLRHARVFVSALAGDDENREVLRALGSAAPFLRRELLRRLTLRHVPDLVFRHDDSIKRGAELTEIIEGLSPSAPGAPVERAGP